MPATRCDDQPTIIVKTFHRPKCLATMLDSLKTQRIDWPVIVTDDGRDAEQNRCRFRCAYKCQIADYLVLPYDSGLSAGRNDALSRVQTKQFVLMDDDFVIQDVRGFRSLQELSRRFDDVDILGGVLIQPHGATEYYGSRMDLSVDGVCRMVDRPPLPPITRGDICLNFFIATTDAVTSLGGWDRELKLSEHWEFFYRAKAEGVVVAETPLAWIHHQRTEPNAEYTAMRARARSFARQARRKHGIHTFIDKKGRTWR